jgi:hypothetical protein
LYASEQRALDVRLDVAGIARGSPQEIARGLLLLAIYIQQLPPEFNADSLHLGVSLHTLLHRYLCSVSDLVTSDDDLACTMEGLDCLIMQTMFYINDGNLRRAWLTSRRCLCVAQFLDCQNAYFSWSRTLDKSDDILKAKAMVWVRAVMLDRYLAPVVGLPSGIGQDCFGDEAIIEPIQTPLDTFERRICVVAGLIAHHNQSRSRQGYTTALAVDEKMDKIIADLGDSIIRIPDLTVKNKSQAEARSFKLMLCQMWFYFSRLCVHIPYMLRAFTEHKFEYSRVACLDASRELLKRYLVLRRTNNTQGTARVVDFSTVIAAATLILNQIGATAHSSAATTDQDDMQLVLQVAASMEAVSRGPRDFMARQGVDVIEKLVDLNSSAPGVASNMKVRLTIPFFGPVIIHRFKRPTGIASLSSLTQAPDEHHSGQAASQQTQAINHAAGLGSGDSLELTPDCTCQSMFESASISDPAWLPQLQAWDFDDVSTWDDAFGLWDVSGWECEGSFTAPESTAD